MKKLEQRNVSNMTEHTTFEFLNLARGFKKKCPVN